VTAIFSPFRTQLEALVAEFGLPIDTLVILGNQSIREYCSQIGCPELETSNTRAAKCIKSVSGPMFLLWDHTDPVDAMVPICGRGFPREDIEKLDDPAVFAMHLLLHEIAHYLRLDLHQDLPTGEIERDCDAWAFEQLKRFRSA
jgi:hypothetical protein